MSKQICFFATQKDINLLLSRIYSLEAIVVDYTGKPFSKEELLYATEYSCWQNYYQHNKFLITRPRASLSYRIAHERVEVDQCISEVIEFSLCTPVPRIVVDTSSVDEEFQKDGMIIIDDTERYDRLMKELMNDPPYIENPSYIENGFEYGRLWYSSTFCNPNGDIIKKTKDGDLLFKNLKTFIQRHFLPSRDKFAYIAPDAYEKYLLGTFVPCSGRNRIVFQRSNSTKDGFVC